MILVPLIDLDLEIESEVYKNAKETIKYLENVVESIDKRVIEGEEIEGFYLEDKKTRIITKNGIDYLAKMFGEEYAYVTTTKEIGITQLEKLLDTEQIGDLYAKGVIGYKVKPTVKVK